MFNSETKANIAKVATVTGIDRTYPTAVVESDNTRLCMSHKYNQVHQNLDKAKLRDLALAQLRQQLHRYAEAEEVEITTSEANEYEPVFMPNIAPASWATCANSLAYAILAAHHSAGEAGIAAQVAYYRTLSDIVVLWHGAKQDTQLTDTELTDFSAKIIALLCQYCGCADDFAWLNSIPEALLSTTDYEKIVSGSALNRWF